MRGLIKRTPECALHVHVGMPDPEAAVRGDATACARRCRCSRRLGANSPFWFGRDSGLASARSAMVRAYPGRGVPPPLRGWDDYLEALDGGRARRRAAPTTRMVWWDVRLQPRLGTVELREIDVQAGLDDAAGARRRSCRRLRAAPSRRRVERARARRRRSPGRGSAPRATASTPRSPTTGG